jgi:hypothetical protein
LAAQQGGRLHHKTLLAVCARWESREKKSSP